MAKADYFWKFCLIPLFYYLFGFLGTGYNFAQYNSLERFFLSAHSGYHRIVSYILLMDIFRAPAKSSCCSRTVFP
jgi:ABC-type multidrug transport system permease subunit